MASKMLLIGFMAHLLFAFAMDLSTGRRHRSVPSPPWHRIYKKSDHNRVMAVIRKCCPKARGDALYCCYSGLFGGFPEDDKPLWECATHKLMSPKEIFSTVRCAQDEFIGRESTNICRMSCCELFENTEGTPTTECSRACTQSSFGVGMTVDQQLQQLRDIGCQQKGQFRFTAFQNCLASQMKPKDDEDDDYNGDITSKEWREICLGDEDEE